MSIIWKSHNQLLLLSLHDNLHFCVLSRGILVTAFSMHFQQYFHKQGLQADAANDINNKKMETRQ